MVQFNSTLSELTAVMNKYNERIDYLEAKLESLEVKQIDKESNRIEHLETTITQLKLDLQDREQEMLSNDVEIAGISEVRNENLMHVTFTVAKKLTVEIEDRDIVSVKRVGPIRALVEGQPVPNPRPIVVRLTRRAQKRCTVAGSTRETRC
ncbi:unnamed protein product [Parnassius apollo]|uniref:(apollo) hypothetical protein n=1 Tax=Parnassius apollo TaxID=110799 RepID=A0A8S3Y8I9_PARAO|nr:unnamed protein product [Parnassius apollo]